MKKIYAKIRNKARVRIRNHGQLRFREPILVLESDDWGLDRGPGADRLSQKNGPLRFIAQDRLETARELENLYQLLEGYRDALGRPYRMVANFIVENPDYEKTRLLDYQKIVCRPISEAGALADKWREGFTRGVFHPQYHGRFHFNFDNMQRDLRDDFPGARQFFENRIHDGFGSLEASAQHNFSEYLCFRTGREPRIPRLVDWLCEGLKIFRQTFGYESESAISPHFVFTPRTLEAMRCCGLKYLQGGNQRTFIGRGGRTEEWIYLMGSHYYPGMVLLARTAKFEPGRGNPGWDVDAAWRRVRWCLKNRIPVVIDTHRFNYTGRFQEESLGKLNELLNRIRDYQPYVLSSDELGEAIARAGQTRLRLSGETVQLTPADKPFGRYLRDKYYWNSNSASGMQPRIASAPLIADAGRQEAQA